MTKVTNRFHFARSTMEWFKFRPTETLDNKSQKTAKESAMSNGRALPRRGSPFMWFNSQCPDADIPKYPLFVLVWAVISI